LLIRAFNYYNWKSLDEKYAFYVRWYKDIVKQILKSIDDSLSIEITNGYIYTNRYPKLIIKYGDIDITNVLLGDINEK